MQKSFKYLNNKYGTFSENETLYYTRIIRKYNATLYLHAFFKGPNERAIEKYFLSRKANLNLQLKEFYSKYNGCSWFYHSFVIYGYMKELQIGYTPLDMETMNSRLLFKNYELFKNYISIGTYGEYEICVQICNKSDEIFIINRNSSEIIRKFSDFDTMMEYCLIEIGKLYNDEGIKINKPDGPDNWFKNYSKENIF